jgi:peptide/nickel transport system substrate-binding protein
MRTARLVYPGGNDTMKQPPSLRASQGAGLLLILMAFWTPGALAAPVYGGHATVLNYAYPEVWDPHIAGTLGAMAAISPMYNQVVEFNPLKPSEVVGDLAKSWEVSTNHLTYTFQLHEHIQWWDGQDLTAEDVAFSLKRMIEPGKPRPRVGLLRPYIKAVEVVDRQTVKVELNYPSLAFLKFLAVDYMKVVPKHVIEAGVDINLWDRLVGSGPFKIKAARRGDSVTYERNPTYFKPGRPYLDGLTIFTITDKGTAAAAFKTGKLVSTTTGPLDVEDVLKLAYELKGKYSLYWQPVTNQQAIFVNVERDPWKDLRVIKALRLATDLQEIQKAFGEGKYVLGAPFPVGSWYGSTPEELLARPGYRSPKAQDIAEAKALLKEAGYDPPSKLGKRILTTNTIWIYPDLAQLWAAQMKRNLGVDIAVKLVDTPSGVTSFTAGDFDLGIFGYAYNIDDPDDYVNALYGPGARNYTRWKNPEFLRMLDQQSKELDPGTRRQRLRQMEAWLFTVEDPYIQLIWHPLFYFVSNKVRTEAGPFIVPETIQTILKREHIWLEE